MDEKQEVQNNQFETYSSNSEVASQETPEAPPEQLIIGEELTQDDLNRLYRRLGRPEDHSKYDLSEVVPDTYNQDIIDAFKQKAYEIGVSQEGAKKLAEWYKDVEVKQLEAMQKARAIQDEQHILQLKTELGTKFDIEINNARKALDAYTDKAFRQYMDDSGLGNHPALVKAFAKIGRELSEDRLVQSDTAVRLAKNAELKQAEIQRLRGNKEFMEKYRRGDPTAVQRLNRLYLED